jgi:hypothetical protein
VIAGAPRCGAAVKSQRLKLERVDECVDYPIGLSAPT